MVLGRLSILILVFTITITSCGLAKKLETIPDKELMQLIKTEKYVVALFSKNSLKLLISSLICLNTMHLSAVNILILSCEFGLVVWLLSLTFIFLLIIR